MRNWRYFRDATQNFFLLRKEEGSAARAHIVYQVAAVDSRVGVYHPSPLILYLRYSVLVGPELKARLGPGRLGRRVPNQDEGGRALLPRSHERLVGMHRQARDSLDPSTVDVERYLRAQQCQGNFSGSGNERFALENAKHSM